MGNRLSTPDQALPFHDLISAPRIGPDPPSVSASPSHANVLIAWRFPACIPIALRQISSFHNQDAIVALRVYDVNRLHALPLPALGNTAMRVCTSGIECLDLDNTIIPLNLLDQRATLSDGVTVEYRVFVWTGSGISDINRCAAEGKGYELVLALANDATRALILERVWSAPSSAPFPESPNAPTHDVSGNCVYAACCGVAVPTTLPSPRAPPKDRLLLDLAGITPVIILHVSLVAIHNSSVKATDCKTARVITAGMSEEQQKMALLAYYAPQSSLIEPNLFLSGVAVSTDLAHLKALGITHIVNAALDACRNEFPDKFTYLGLRLSDSKHEDVVCCVYDVIEFIDMALSKPHHRVLVHCHRGISRSAALVIAYLMLKRRLPFNHAFDLVKARRDIVSPNIGFSVALIEWHRRMQVGAADAPVIYRITSFSPTRDPLCTVAKLVERDARFDARGVYVIQTTNAIYVWIGSRSQRLLYAYAKQTLIPRLQRFEKGPPIVFDVHDGDDSPLFLSLFGERKVPFGDGCVADYDAEYTALTLPLPDRWPDASAAVPTRSGSVSYRPILTMVPIVVPLVCHSDRGHAVPDPIIVAGEESGFAVFYSWPSLQEIEVFGPEDLSDDAVFVFVHRKAKSRSAKLFVWAGTDVDIGADTNEFIEAIASDCIGRLRLQELDTAILFEKAGDESDEFWDLF